MIGQTISHYKILEKLGEGGMGVVYKAHDTKLDRVVALKFLPQYLTSDSNEKERFYHEARAASALNHANITTIHEINEHDGQLYIAMEFIEGKTLKQVAEHDEPSLKKVLDIAIQVCDGLAAAAEKGVVHRDIKSDNIMLTSKGQVKIMDFGLAKLKGATKLTKAGSTLGTAAYMSPEQATGEEVDHRSDIFSFGVVLYELLAGTLPFRGEHQAAIAYSIVNEDPQPLTRFNQNVSPDLERAVYKALAKNREERYQHIDDLLADLRHERKNLEYARSGYLKAGTISAPMPLPKPKKKFVRYAIVGTVVVLLVVLFMIFNPFNLQVSSQKTTAAQKNSLAVLYFENIPDPDDKDHTGEMLSNLLTTSLFQTKDIEVISRERLYDIQKELGQTDVKTISPSMATKVAQRAGVSMMLLGSILQKQPSLAVTYRLIEVQTGKIISTQRLSGIPVDKIFSLVDTLALLVKNDLNVTPSAGTEMKSVASVTTKSPEAYRSFLEGIELNNRFYASEATAAFRRAIELDSAFAMAYFQLATVNLGTLTPEEFQNAMKKAYALSANTTERERLLIQATYASGVEQDQPKAISILENLLQKYPHEQTAYEGLSTLYGQQGEFEKVNELYAKELQSDSLDKTLWNSVAYLNAGLNRKREAMNAIDRYLQLAPAEPNPYDSKGDIYAQFDERDSAVIWWKKAIAFRSDFPSAQKLLSDALVRQDSTEMEQYISKATASAHVDEKFFREEGFPFLLMSHGQITKARTERKKLLDSHRNKKQDDPVVGDLENLIMLEYELRDYPAMVQYAQEYSIVLRKDSASNPNYGRMMIAIAQSKNGNPQAVTNVLEAVNHSSAGNVMARARYDYGLGIISFENGKYSAALEQMNSAFRVVPPHHAPLYHHAVCLLKSGNTTDAIAELNRLTRWSPIQYDFYDLGGLPFAPYWLIGSVKAHYWLGVAYEQQGKKDDAKKEYQQFLQIWKDADFESPELKDAKARLTKLKVSIPG